MFLGMIIRPLYVSKFHGPKKKDTDHVNIKKMSAKSGQTSRGMTMLLLWAMLLSVAVFVPSAHGLAVEDEDQMRVLAMNEELFSAAQRGETMMVLMKLSDGAQPEGYKNDIKVTALIAASERGHTDVVSELLDKNASVTHQDAVMHPKRCPAACPCQLTLSKLRLPRLMTLIQCTSRRTDGQP